MDSDIKKIKDGMTLLMNDKEFIEVNKLNLKI